MYKPHFLDFQGSKLPSLERNILRFRAMHLVLMNFYVEELKRTILNLIQETDAMDIALSDGEEKPNRIPKGTPHAFKKALNILVKEGEITEKDKSEISSLIWYRNISAHEIHQLFSDLTMNRYAREIRRYSSKYIVNFDYKSIERLKFFREKINSLSTNSKYIFSISLNPILFETAEKTILQELNNLKTKIDKLYEKRIHNIKNLNAEILNVQKNLGEKFATLNSRSSKQRNGKLSQTGMKLCYQLFDNGVSDLAVAHLMQISLASVRKRKKTWLKIEKNRRFPGGCKSDK